jgi:cell wall-associated NlpC family hydrolase
MNLDLLKPLAIASIGKPYQFGAKWDLKDPNPQGPVDCSGFVRWLCAQLGQDLPDGSENQFEATKAVITGIPGDLGFNRNPGEPTDHVFMCFDEWDVIEARGTPYNKVILRSRARWESWPTFTGWRRM